MTQAELFMLEPLILSAEDFPASLLAWPDEKRERQITATSGRKCFASYNKHSPLGSLVKMLLTSPIWHSRARKLTWKVRATPCNHLWFQLVPSERHTDATEYGLWATPNTMDSLPPRSKAALEKQMSGPRKGRRKTANLRDQLVHGMFYPTPTTSDAKGASSKRFLGSDESHGNLREVIRAGETDGQYPHPEFVEWMMGFPTGHTDLNR